MTIWPKHTDGRNKKIGEMTREESRAVFADSCLRLKAEFEHPVKPGLLVMILNGERVD